MTERYFPLSIRPLNRHCSRVTPRHVPCFPCRVCFPTGSAAAASRRDIQLPRYDRTAALAPLAALIEHTSGRPTRIVLLDTPDALADAMCNGDIDVAMTNLGAFVNIRECPGIEAIAVLDSPPAVLDRYRGVLLARRDSRVATLANLHARAGGLRYAEVLPGSTSGALVQAAALRSVRTRPSSFLKRHQSGTHDAALEDLLAGRADIGALAEEPWQKLQTEAPERAAGLRLLWRSEALPPGPVVCRHSAVNACTAIRSALLGPAGATVAKSLSEGWAETRGANRFRPYDRTSYDAFKAERR